MNSHVLFFLVLLCIPCAVLADEAQRYDGRTYGIEFRSSDGVTYPTVRFGDRTFRFAYRTDGHGIEGERPVRFHGMRSRGYDAELSARGLCVRYVHDLHLTDGSREKVGEAKTEIRCTDDLIGVQTTITPEFPGRFAINCDHCFYQVVTFPDFSKWVGVTLLTTDAIGTNRMNQLMPHAEFNADRWGMNGCGLRTIVFGGVPDVLVFRADRAATLKVNRYRDGFECDAGVRHPHPQCRSTPWDGPLAYRYFFKMER